MCGLFGHIYGKTKPDLSASRNALHTLTHRGPDQWGEFYDDHIYISHRRLAILDLSDNAKQPMISQQLNGGKVIMSVNGEIWNFNNLRDKLKKKYQFKSTSDSEVLLHGYIEWGIENLLSRIDGMYAISIYDQKKQTLHLARDRYGIKPLYYTQNNKNIAYASEIKVLFSIAPDLRRFSNAGTHDWLLHRGSHSSLTPYHKINRLLPGERLEINLQTQTIKNHIYYDIIDDIDLDNPSDPVHLDQLVDNAVDKRLISDVPVGLQLSGGVDSSLIACAMRKKIITKQIHSFSIGFSDKDEEKLSEEPYARRVAKQLNLTHHQLNISRRDIADNFEYVLRLCDGMLDFPNTIAIYMLGKFAKDKVTVHLTGEGADELFGGYGKYRHMATIVKQRGYAPNAISACLGKIRPALGRKAYLAKNYARQPNKILNNLNAYIPADKLSILGEPPKAMIDTIYKPGSDKRKKFESLPFEKQLLILDHKTYLAAVLERQDRGSMGASIESRVPFLDRNLIKWAVNLPANQLFDKKQTKILLKQKAEREFDSAFAHRRKVGFPLPLTRWMHANDGLKEFLNLKDQNQFLFHDHFKTMETAKGFNHRLLNYPDPEHQWTDWFAMVLANAQKQFNITDIVQ